MNSEILSIIAVSGAYFPVLALSILFGAASYNSKDEGARFYNFFYYLNPRRGLASQSPLRFWMCLIVAYFLATGLVCWSGYQLRFTPASFEKFVEISKFPLAVLSLTLPVGLFISRLHNTQQTAVQIEAAESKNRLDAFHGQRKGIVDYIGSIGKIEMAPGINMELTVNQAFHSIIFCNSTHLIGANEADKEAINHVTLEIDSALLHLAFLMPEIEELRRRRQVPTKLTRELHYIHLIDITRRLCEHLKVRDYTLEANQTKSSTSINYIDEQDQTQSRKLDIPAVNCPQVLALLNYCCTITYYAAISEHRSSSEQDLYDIKRLYGELRSLCFANSISGAIDRVSIYSSQPALWCTHEQLVQMPEGLRI